MPLVRPIVTVPAFAPVPMFVAELPEAFTLVVPSMFVVEEALPIATTPVLLPVLMSVLKFELELIEVAAPLMVAPALPVIRPDTPSVLLSVAAPVTPSVLLSVVAPVTPSVPPMVIAPSLATIIRVRPLVAIRRSFAVLALVVPR